MPDAFVLPDTSTPRPRDAGSVDAGGLHCAYPWIARRITRACDTTGTGSIQPGVESELPVFVENDCFCGQELLCEALVVPGEVRTVALTTWICPDLDIDCDGCGPMLRGTCSLPPMEAGIWPTTVNGEPAFDLVVAPARPISVEEPRCWTTAPEVEDPSLDPCPWPGDWPPFANQVCHPLTVEARRSAIIRVVNDCGNCFDVPGTCDVQLRGDRLILQPSQRACSCPSCGACSSSCVSVSVDCRTPPLPEGRYAITMGPGPPLGFLDVRDRTSDAIVCSGGVVDG